MERLLHYTSLVQETPTVAQGGPPPPKGWPSVGRIEYKAVTAIYRTGLPPVLRDLTFTLEVGTAAADWYCGCSTAGGAALLDCCCAVPLWRPYSLAPHAHFFNPRRVV